MVLSNDIDEEKAKNTFQAYWQWSKHHLVRNQDRLVYSWNYCTSPETYQTWVPLPSTIQDALMSWRWVQLIENTNQSGIIYQTEDESCNPFTPDVFQDGTQVASDGDILVAFALLCGFERFHEPDFYTDALAIIKDLRKKTLIDFSAGEMLNCSKQPFINNIYFNSFDDLHTQGDISNPEIIQDCLVWEGMNNYVGFWHAPLLDLSELNHIDIQIKGVSHGNAGVYFKLEDTVDGHERGHVYTTKAPLDFSNDLQIISLTRNDFVADINDGYTIGELNWSLIKNLSVQTQTKRSDYYIYTGFYGDSPIILHDEFPSMLAWEGEKCFVGFDLIQTRDWQNVSEIRVKMSGQGTVDFQVIPENYYQVSTVYPKIVLKEEDTVAIFTPESFKNQHIDWSKIRRLNLNGHEYVQATLKSIEIEFMDSTIKKFMPEPNFGSASVALKSIQIHLKSGQTHENNGLHLISNAHGAPFINPSYFMPFAYRKFMDVDQEGTVIWQTLLDQSYKDLEKSLTIQLHDLNQNRIIGNGHLFPNWFQLDPLTGHMTDVITQKQSNTVRGFVYGYDAFRTIAFLCIDYYLHHDPRSYELLQKVYPFFANELTHKGLIYPEYKIDGTPIIQENYELTSFGFYSVYLNLFNIMNDQDNINRILKMYYNDHRRTDGERVWMISNEIAMDYGKTEYFMNLWTYFGNSFFVNNYNGPILHFSNDPLVFSVAGTNVLTVCNYGNTSLSVQSLEIQGPDAQHFTIRTQPFTLEPEEIIEIEIDFISNGCVESNATLVLQTNSGLFQIQLLGQNKVNFLSSHIIHFDPVIVNTSTEKELIIQNPLSSSIEIGNITNRFDSTPFQITSDQCSEKVVLPNQSCSVNIQFFPNTNGNDCDRLSIPIINELCNHTIHVELSGNAIEWSHPPGKIEGTINWTWTLPPLYDGNIDTNHWTELDEARIENGEAVTYFGVTFYKPTQIQGVRFYSYPNGYNINHIETYKVKALVSKQWINMTGYQSAMSSGWTETRFENPIIADAIHVLYSKVSYGYAPKVGEIEFLSSEESAQTIQLSSGWNLVSFNHTAPIMDLQNLFHPLIDNNSLVKVIDEHGNSMLNRMGQWINQIGNADPARGYLVKMNNSNDLTVSGLPGYCNADDHIVLTKGWNIIGWPYDESGDARILLQSLIDQNFLIKATDETGHTIIFIDGQWRYGFDVFESGKGYLIKVSENSILPVHFNATIKKRSIQSYKTENNTSTHFQPVWSSTPFERTNVWIDGIVGCYPLKPNDEIAIFDGERCVGVGLINEIPTADSLLTITCSKEDENDGLGFQEGNTIFFRIWDASQQIEISTNNIVPQFFNNQGNSPIHPQPFKPREDYLVTLSVTQSIHSSSGTGGTISPSGNQFVSCGDNQHYTITPFSDYHIKDVLVDGVSLGAISSYTFNQVTESHQIEAIFEINTFVVTIHTSGTGHGTVDPPGPLTVNAGGSVSLKPIPDSCSIFNSWYGHTSFLSNSSDNDEITSVLSNIRDNKDITAVFHLKNFIISVDYDSFHGKISPPISTMLQCGSNQCFSIEPDKGYHHTLLIDGVEESNALTQFCFNSISEDHSIKVQFTNDPPVISDIQDYTIHVNKPISGIPFRIEDRETLPENLSLSVTSSNPTIISNQTIQIINNGAGNRELSINPITDQYGDAVITVTVTDEIGRIASTSFAVSVQLVTHTIHLHEGWNMISSYVKPINPSFEFMLNPLIQANTLVKVIGSSGTILFMRNQWQYGLDTLENQAGYLINVSKESTLSVTGIPIQQPQPIILSQGWNLIGYPFETSQDFMNVIQSLKDSKRFIKIVGENGTILNVFGNTKNTIGDIQPGKGYWLKINQGEDIEFLVPHPTTPVTKRLSKSNPIIPVTHRKSLNTHFQPIWQGNPFNRMNIWITGIHGLELSNNDEIAIFDGDHCVGVSVVSDTISYSNILLISASMDDGIYTYSNEVNGFTNNNPIFFRIWKSNDNKEYKDFIPVYSTISEDQFICPPGFEDKGDFAVQLAENITHLLFNIPQKQQIAISILNGLVGFDCLTIQNNMKFKMHHVISILQILKGGHYDNE